MVVVGLASSPVMEIAEIGDRAPAVRPVKTSKQTTSHAIPLEAEPRGSVPADSKRLFPQPFH
jgi:hypothetical protein